MPIWQILAIIAALVELVAGLLIAFNVLRGPRLSSSLSARAMIFYIHDFWNMAGGPDRMNNIVHALKNLSIKGAFLMLAAWLPIPGEAAHRSGIMPPTHSEMISPAVPR
jgi:uncharacterized membrane protein YphA (DoxX/SURF4 family)